MMVTYGNASGPPPRDFAAGTLQARLVVPDAADVVSLHSPRGPTLTRAAQELFDLIARDVIKVRIGQTYPLQEAARAHTDLEARRTTGSTVLLP